MRALCINIFLSGKKLRNVTQIILILIIMHSLIMRTLDCFIFYFQVSTAAVSESVVRPLPFIYFDGHNSLVSSQPFLIQRYICGPHASGTRDQ
jgi:hypothetical protein